MVVVARKTVDLDLLVEACNGVLALADDRLSSGPLAADARSYRLGVIGVCEQALHMASAYRGFRYQATELGPDGTLVVAHDDTRRVYLKPTGRGE